MPKLFRSRVVWVLLFLGTGGLCVSATQKESRKAICLQLQKPGSCPADKPRAAIVYDPEAFSTSTGELYQGQKLMKATAPHAECYIFRKHFEAQGGCVEGIAFEDSQTLRRLLRSTASIKGRYQYIANLTHGLPGIWHMRSPCQARLQKVCREKDLKNKAVEECTEEELGNAQNAAWCPCYASAGAWSKAQKNFESASADEKRPIQELAALESASNLALQQYQACTVEKDHQEFYRESVAGGDFSQMIAPQGSLLSISCSTSPDAWSPRALQKEVCEGAAEGLKYNLARTFTGGAQVCPSREFWQRKRSELAQACASGQCSLEAAQRQDQELKKLLQQEFQVVTQAAGNFSCFRCEKKASVPIPCQELAFPPEVKLRSDPPQPEFVLPEEERPAASEGSH